MTSQSRFLRVAPLLFGSGFCALVYQTTWLREFRLIFGSSTAASAAVLGIFMGGLGLGSAILGRRSEAKRRPLEFYAKLELMIAGSVVLTPALIWLIRQLYLALGGTVAMGLGFGTVVRLLLSVLVLGLPTFLMGGTLPAAARVVVGYDDTNRRSLALLYGINTLGAVAGTAAATFYFFEAWGNHITLSLAAAFNVLVGLVAFLVSKSLPVSESAPAPREEAETAAVAAPPSFVFVAAAIAGFAFLLMELVWYRMLSPLLGGTTFTFGLILSVALLGIGLGGILFAVCFSGKRVTLQAFALVSALEALFIAIPYALGDRIALAAMLLRPLGAMGFHGHVIAWTALCALVALPAAVIAGMQFPMLIALLGKGKARVGSQTGLAYAWNTAGAIAGSLAGGFGLIPALSAPGVWKLAVGLLCILAGAAAIIAAQRRIVLWRIIPALGTAAAAIFLLTALGPTAFWRHSQIGAGRLTKFTGSKSEFHDLQNMIRRDILWETDGVESSVAVSYGHGINFVVNGRCDGHSRGDAGTQVMAGLLPASLHPNPTRALVVGLGTGSTAGWLGAVPSIERVDVVEFEPAILRVARDCAAVNQQALNNPKVHVIIGDGREVLLSSSEQYDVIASEPSNPYRAGVASLFTVEFYQAAARRLKPGGMFAQWVQAYEVDPRTIETVYATLGSVFPNIETWQTQHGDLLLVGSASAQPHDADALRARIAQEPFKSALLHTWGVTNLEGMLAHLVADNSLAEAMKRGRDATLNTDDRTVLEFAFARNVDLSEGFHISSIRPGARLSRADRLPIRNGEVDWDAVEAARLSMQMMFGEKIEPKDYSDPEEKSRAAAFASFLQGDPDGALALWRQHPHEVTDINELRMVAECMAQEGKPTVAPYIEKLRETLPTEADAILAHFLVRRGQWEEATDVLEKVFHALRTDPWPGPELTQRTLKIAEVVAKNSKSDVLAQRLYQALREPFSAFNSDEPRLMKLLSVGILLDKDSYGSHTLAAIEPEEPYVPWQSGFLQIRKSCYKAIGSPRLAQAERELDQFLKEQPANFDPAAFRKEIPIDSKDALALSSTP